jgi:hypothetical protein
MDTPADVELGANGYEIDRQTSQDSLAHAVFGVARAGKADTLFRSCFGALAGKNAPFLSCRLFYPHLLPLLTEDGRNSTRRRSI